MSSGLNSQPTGSSGDQTPPRRAVFNSYTTSEDSRSSTSSARGSAEKIISSTITGSLRKRVDSAQPNKRRCFITNKDSPSVQYVYLVSPEETSEEMASSVR